MARVDVLKRDVEQVRKDLIELSAIPKDSIDIYPELVQKLILEKYDRLEQRIDYLETEIKRYAEKSEQLKV